MKLFGSWTQKIKVRYFNTFSKRKRSSFCTTVQSRINRGMSKHSVELNYCFNRKIFMQHIRLIHKFFSPKNSADRPDFWIFGFFFFSSRSFCGIAFFSEKMFLANFLDTQKVSKHHEKFFGKQNNIKELSHKKFWMYTQKAQKYPIFSIFWFSGEKK